MNKILWLTVLFAGIAGATEVKVLALKPDAESKKAYFAQPVRLWGTGGFLKDPAARYTLITLGNAKINYVFGLSGRVDESGRLKGTLQLIRPSGANWHSANFRLGGDTSRNCFVSLADLGNGGFTAVYENDRCKFTFRFVLPEGEDKLLLTAVPVKYPQGVAEYSVEWLAYPSSYGGNYKSGLKLRRRAGTTNLRSLAGGVNRLCPTEYRVMLFDEYFDPEHRRGDGPCAMLFNPKTALRTDVIIGDYACYVRSWRKISVPTELILCEYKGKSNRAVMDIMRGLEAEF